MPGRQANTGARLGTAGLILLLGGCSGTAFGDRLAGSFSAAPAPAPAAPAPVAPKATTTSGPGATAKPPTDATGQRDKTQTLPTAKPGRLKPAPGPALMAPAPYRVTIKLPAADPSAPAEVVTEALRQAGVPFEVEMIERVSGTAPAPTPAPQPRPR
ncbi:MAG: hypothetical protein VKM98_03820 [Cyanobacteriota bacterium]|nr:hypothetical protein [Cyanobacteriota bacterium]